MIRKIKFRGKPLSKDSPWVFGYYYVIPKGSSINPGEDAHLIIAQIPEKFKDIFPPGITEIDPDTVGEFAGFNDRHGMDVYEGDYVTAHNGKSDNYGNRIKQKFKVDLFSAQWIAPHKYIEIVGNIYDTPRKDW